MLTDIQQAPIIGSDGVFNPAPRKLLSSSGIQILGEECAWVETAGSLLVDGVEYEALATLVPISCLSVPVQKGQSEPLNCASHPDPETFPEVYLGTEQSTGLLDALALVFKCVDTKRLHAYAFNGHLDDLIEFDNGDTMSDCMDTVVAMFSVVGTKTGVS
jgi:hypothetical protein